MLLERLNLHWMPPPDAPEGGRWQTLSAGFLQLLMRRRQAARVSNDLGAVYGRHTYRRCAMLAMEIDDSKAIDRECLMRSRATDLKEAHDD